MASAEEFVVTLYNFEPQYEEGEESSNLSESEWQRSVSHSGLV